MAVSLVDFQQTYFSLRKASLKLTQPDKLPCVTQSGITFHIQIFSAHIKAISYFNLLSLKVYIMEMSCSIKWRNACGSIFPRRVLCLLSSQFFSHFSLFHHIQTSCLDLLFPHPLSILCSCASFFSSVGFFLGKCAFYQAD